MDLMLKGGGYEEGPAEGKFTDPKDKNRVDGENDLVKGHKENGLMENGPHDLAKPGMGAHNLVNATGPSILAMYRRRALSQHKM